MRHWPGDMTQEQKPLSESPDLPWVRAYIASQVLPALIMSENYEPKEAAATAVEFADALIEALK